MRKTPPALAAIGLLLLVGEPALLAQAARPTEWLDSPDQKSVFVTASYAEQAGRKARLPKHEGWIGTQLPIQHRIGYRYSVYPFSGYLSFGITSRPYLNLVLNVLANRHPESKGKYQFIESNLTGGPVWEFGFNYHRKQWYGGPFLQYQSFSITATPQSLIEHLAPERVYSVEERVNNLAGRFPVVEEFYRQSEITPVVRPWQLGFLFGRRFQFKKLPRLGLAAEIAYSFNVDVNSRMESRSGVIGNFLLQTINPAVEKSLRERFSKFNIPYLSLSLTYQLRPLPIQ